MTKCQRVLVIFLQLRKASKQMVFYNGFNLLVDIILVAVVYAIAHGIGYRKGIKINKPPF